MKRFTMKDETFTCEACSYNVPKAGYTARDHCPRCLTSKHVDISPGDRKNTCHGLLIPIGVEKFKNSFKIIYRCQTCGELHKNIMLQDDSMDKIIELSIEK